jgi:hypothetical protein
MRGECVDAPDHFGAQAVGVHHPALAFNRHHLANDLALRDGGVADAACVSAQNHHRPTWRWPVHNARHILFIDSDKAVGRNLFLAPAEHDVSGREADRFDWRNDHDLIVPNRGVHAAAGSAETHRTSVFQAITDQAFKHGSGNSSDVKELMRFQAGVEPKATWGNAYGHEPKSSLHRIIETT